MSVYKSLIPNFSPTIGAEDVLEATRTGFFQQALARLTEILNNSEGSGYLLAQSLNLDYEGEGIDAFLNALRKSQKKEDRNHQEK